MGPWQVWLVGALDGVPEVAALMRTAWMWPLAESVHFIGLSMLVGSVVLFDLRLLGLAPRIPIRAMHRLIPLGLAGFAMNAGTGLLFLLTDGGQYIYNPAFLFKIAFIAAAGANAAMFYLTVAARVGGRDAPFDAPGAAKLFAGLSLVLWLGVIIAGRLLTFYRPFDCAPGEASGSILLCVPGPD